MFFHTHYGVLFTHYGIRMVLFSLCDTHLIRPFLCHPHTVPTFCSFAKKCPQLHLSVRKRRFARTFLWDRHNLTGNWGERCWFFPLFHAVSCYSCVVNVNVMSPATNESVSVCEQQRTGRANRVRYNVFYCFPIIIDMIPHSFLTLHCCCRMEEAWWMYCPMRSTEWGFWYIRALKPSTAHEVRGRLCIYKNVINDA